MLRGLLFDNLGLKLVALLLAVLVYLNVYTDRQATMIVSFPLQYTDLPDSLSLAGPSPTALQAELHGTAKQLIRLRVTEPPVRISLAGVGVGRYVRALGIGDLPLPEGGNPQVNRVVSPRTLELDIERRVRRSIPVSTRVGGQPAGGMLWDGSVRFDPDRVVVSGPETSLADLDTVRLAPVSVQGRRDTLVVSAGPLTLPDWCTIEPEQVEIRVPIEAGMTRRIAVAVEPPAGERTLRASPARVSAVVSMPRRLAAAPLEVRARWVRPAGSASKAGMRVSVVPVETAPGLVVRFEPDSVALQPVR